MSKVKVALAREIMPEITVSLDNSTRESKNTRLVNRSRNLRREYDDLDTSPMATANCVMPRMTRRTPIVTCASNNTIAKRGDVVADAYRYKA